MRPSAEVPRARTPAAGSPALTTLGCVAVKPGTAAVAHPQVLARHVAPKRLAGDAGTLAQLVRDPRRASLRVEVA
eukprot:671038-Prymnesium_polylepis.1